MKNIFIKYKNQILIILLGILLGIISKWLDNLSIDDSIWWQYIIGVLDLRNILSEMPIWILIALIISIYSKKPISSSINVFIFFLSMTISYHLYSIFICEFNPFRYMLIWYGITIISPVLAYICWYSKKDNNLSIIIKSIIISTMLIFCFSIGPWYFYLNGIINLLIFITTIIVLYTNPKNMAYSIIIGIVLSYLVKSIL